MDTIKSIVAGFAILATPVIFCAVALVTFEKIFSVAVKTAVCVL